MTDLKDETEISFSLKPNKVLHDVEKSLISLGKMETSSKPSTTFNNNLKNVGKYLENLQTTTKLSTALCAAQVEKFDFMKSQVTFVEAVTKRELGVNTWFIGGTYLNDGRLIMADFNNKRLVQLDNKFNFVKEYKIDGKPTDVAAGNNSNEVYIAVNGNSVYKCTLGTDLKVKNKITSPSGTYGLAVTSDNIIAGTYSEVVYLTHDGSTVKTIPMSNPDSYVAVSQSCRSLYHTDRNAIVSWTLEGKKTIQTSTRETETSVRHLS